MNCDQLKNKFSNFADSPFRPYQEEAVEFAINSSKPIVVIQAPTGFGKSLTAACIGAHYKNFIYLVSSKQLQKQLNEDFPEMELMKGRNNYPCIKVPGTMADDCHHTKKKPCFYKRECPYEIQKNKVLAARYKLLNYHYFLFESNFVGKFSDSPLVICDEGDLLEGLLAGFVSLNISGRLAKHLDVYPPKYLTTQSEFALANWVKWAEQVAESTKKALFIEQDKADSGLDADAKLIKQLKSTEFQLKVFIENVDKLWIYERRRNFKFGPASLQYRPTWITEQLSEEYFFRHADKFVIMSATFPPAQILGKLLGRPPGDFDYFTAPSSFPVENRRVYLNPVANITKKEMEKNEDKILGKVVDEIINLASVHLDQKGVIHTVSYKIAQFIMDQGIDRFITHNGRNREEIIDEFINSDRPLILVSPSSDRGIDLPDDLCRFIVWVKAPFLSLGDKLTQKRAFSGPVGGLWYKSLAAQTIVQGCGRGVRHKDDYCTMYCLDKQIYDLIIKKGSLFPEYFRDAVEIV